MEISKVFLLTLVIIQNLFDNVSMKTMANEDISKNVVFVYSNTNNNLHKKTPKTVGTIVMPQRETKIYVVYPEKIIATTSTITANTTTTEKNPSYFSTISNLESVTDAAEKYDSIEESTYFNENSLTTENINQMTTEMMDEENSTPFWNFDEEIIFENNEAVQSTTLKEVTEDITTFDNFDSNTESVTTINSNTYDSLKLVNYVTTTMSSIDSDVEEYKENEIEIQGSEKHTTTLIPRKNKIRKKKSRKYLKINTSTEFNISSNKSLVSSSSTTSRTVNEQPNYKSSNMTKTYKNEIKTLETPTLTNKRDSLLRQSIKSKKFISALMERNKHRISTTILNTSFPETITIPLKTTVNVTNGQTNRRIYMPRLTTTTTKRRKFKPTTKPTTTTSPFKDTVTLFPDEISDQELATEWRSMKISKPMNKSARALYRGRKRFSISDIVKVQS